MLPQTSTATLATLINKLRSERRELAGRLTAIDATFDQLGISREPTGRRSLKSPGAPAGKRGRRQRGYDQTAAEFVLGLLDGKKLLTAEVNAAWNKAGRAGTADTTLMNLVTAKKLTRRKVRGGRGSRYSTV